jgi:hypothetical protein
MARHSGKDGTVFMSVSGTTQPSEVASLDNWELDMSAPGTDVSSFGDANDREVIGRPKVSGTFSGNWDDMVTVPWVGRRSTDGVIMYCYPNKKVHPTKFASGPAWVDMKIATNANGKVSISGTFRANGDWGDTFGTP